MRKFLTLILTLAVCLNVFAQHLKKDGTPDMRFKENKSSYSPSTYNRPPVQTTTSFPASTSTIHLKKDGTPDLRYQENKRTYSNSSTYTPPARYHFTPNYSGTSSRIYKSSTTKSYRGYTSKSFTTSTHRPRYKTTTWASVAERDSKGRFIRSSSAKLAFMKATGYPHGRPGYVVDHIIPLKKSGCDCPGNMQWQTIAEAKAKDKWE